MGIYSDFDRKDRDFYPTPLKAAKPLLSHINETNIRGNFIEPCSGDGKLVTLVERYSVLNCRYISDIEPACNAIHTKDNYLVNHKVNVLDEDWDYIAEQVKADFFITNPPWMNTKKSGYLRLSVIEKLANCRPTWLLLAGNYAMNLDMWADFNGNVG